MLNEQFVMSCWSFLNPKASPGVDKAVMWRYVDDFVCAFEFKEDAEWFYKELGPRLKKFELELAEDKTKLIQFIPEGNSGPKPGFDFLGFEFRWGLNRWGKPTLKRRTARKKYRASLANFRAWSKESRNLPLQLLFGKLGSKLHGYYNYYGLRFNSKSLWDFLYQVERILFKVKTFLTFKCAFANLWANNEMK